MECWPLLPCWCWGFCSIGGYDGNSIGYGWLLSTLSPLLSFVTTKDKPNAAASTRVPEVILLALVAAGGLLGGAGGNGWDASRDAINLSSEERRIVAFRDGESRQIASNTRREEENILRD